MASTGYFKRILLPSLIAILLFLAAMYMYVIPGYQDSLMERKRETITELTHTGWSLLQQIDATTTDSMGLQYAQHEAREIIRGIRYGPERKDYFWITDTTPVMIMHPYQPHMEGSDLEDYTDPGGKKFFMEITDLVSKQGDGFIDYKWQWKDDSLMVVPKLSYVKLYEPWGWIVGTGIYVEDVKKEIATITRRVIWISVWISMVITAVISYLARRNLKAEQQRHKAMVKQKDAMEKYKKLVEASTDGIVMILENEIVYYNPPIQQLLGYSTQMPPGEEKEFLESLKELTGFANEHTGKTSPETVREQKIRKKDHTWAEVIVSRSVFDMHGKQGYICTLKDVSRISEADKAADLHMDKFKAAGEMLQAGVFRCTLGRNARFTEVNQKLIHMLGYTSAEELKKQPLQELFHDRFEKKEIIRSASQGLSFQQKLVRLKKPDGTILPVTASLFPVKDRNHKPVYCDGILLDAYEQLNRNMMFRTKPIEEQLSAHILLKGVKDFRIEAPICEMDTPLEVAARLMTMRHSDIILVKSEKGQAIGLVTHSDISRRAVARNLDIQTPVSHIMSAPVISVSDQEMVMDAFSLMVEHKISYIIVQPSEKGCPGYISLLALSDLRRDTPEFLIHQIHKARHIEDITGLMPQLPRLVARFMETGTGAATSGKIISRVTDAVSQQIIRQAVAQTGEPPAPFVFLALGSEGRREQSLATDQDNAIVFDAGDATQESGLQAYFLQLGKTICTLLQKAGYPFCQGNVMAMNPQWCSSLEAMKKQITQWVEMPNPQELLKVGIFFDFRPVYGDFELANKLQAHCHTTLKDQRSFFYHLAQNTISLKPPLNVMGQISFESTPNQPEWLDIKKPLMALTGIMRLWSLKYGVTHRNTMERLRALQSAGIMAHGTGEEFSQALRYLMLLRVKNQLQQLENNENPGNTIQSLHLSELDRSMLKKIFTAIAAHQNRMAIEFRIS